MAVNCSNARRCAIVLLVSGSALAASVVPAQESSDEHVEVGPPSRRLVVLLRTHSDDGKVYCSLYRGAEGYPTVRERAVGQARDVTLNGGQAVCIFEHVTPGEYAVAAFHDENGNNDLDLNFLGIPSEGTGASNGEHNTFGPPRYNNARFVFPDVQTHRIRIEIHY